MRQITLDTETTGLAAKRGDRIIEIGCVEIIDRVITGNTFHSYINPERLLGPQITAITGIKDEFLIDKPKFSEVAGDFLDFINGAELIIHNAPFDVEFINNELQLLNHGIKDLTAKFKIIDTLVLARSMHPGQRNNLDALSKRYKINCERVLHGALVDATILAKLVLKMTAGQVSFDFDLLQEKDLIPKSGYEIHGDNNLLSSGELINFRENKMVCSKNKKPYHNKNLKIIYANLEEESLHKEYLQDLLK